MLILLRFFLFRQRIKYQPSHVASQGAHGLHAIFVLFSRSGPELQKNESRTKQTILFFAKCQGLVTCDGGSIVPIYFSINIK